MGWRIDMDGFERAVASLPGRERVYRNSHGGEIYIHATAAETGGAIGMWETFSAPGTGPHRHTHTRETEIFRVIEGYYRFWCGDDVVEGGPGLTVTLPPRVPHCWRNISDGPGRMLAIVTPGGFEQLFVDIVETGASTPAEILALETALGIVDSELAQHSPPPAA
jgi:quercetin dioxygenase-like cupin family protein